MPIETSDVRSNPKEQIKHAAEVINRSKDCRKVFIAVQREKSLAGNATARLILAYHEHFETHETIEQPAIKVSEHG